MKVWWLHSVDLEKSLSSKRDHEEMGQGDDEVMEGTYKKIKT